MKRIAINFPVPAYRNALLAGVFLLSIFHVPAYAEMIPAIASDAFVDAIGTYPVLPKSENSPDAFLRNVAMLQDISIRHAFVSIPWTVNRSPNFNNILLLAKYGVKSVVLTSLKVDGKGAYHCDEPVPPVTPPKCTRPPADVVAVVKALGPGTVVEGVAGPNEYADGGHNDDPEAIAKLAAYMRALKKALASDAATQNIPIIGPTFDPSPHLINPLTGNPKVPKASPAFWEPSPSLDLACCVDYANIHIYDLPFDESSKGKADRNWWEEHLFRYELAGYPQFDKSHFMMTETGFGTGVNNKNFGRALSLAEQARYVPRQLLRYFKEGFKRIYLYQLEDRGADRNDIEQTFGIVYSDGKPKPAYFALKRLLNRLSEPGAQFLPKPVAMTVNTSAKTVEYLLLQKSTGIYYLVLWDMVDSGDAVAVSADTVDVIFKQPMKDIRVYDPIQSDTPIVSMGAQRGLHIPIAGDVLLVEFHL